MLEDLLTLGGDGSGHLEDNPKMLDKVLKKAENIVKLVKS